MIKSKDLNQGTVIEVVSLNNMMFFGDFMTSPPVYMAVNEQYTVTKVKRSSPLEVHLSQINGNKKGPIFFSFLNKDIKILSQPELEVVKNTDANTLAPNEEFILVKKGDPTQFYKDYVECKDTNYNQTNDYALIFTNKIGQRKKIKNKLSLMASLNICTGMFYSTYWYKKCNQLPKESADLHQYHMIVVKDINYWYESLQISNIDSLKDLELRKYNKDTRKVSDTVADFDCYAYVINFINKMTDTFNFGAGIASVIDELKNKGQENEYPFLFSAKFDHTKFQYDPPLERDIYFDLALKSLKLKKKDVIHYNDKGFVCIAFKTEEERDKFVKEYKNTEKVYNLSLTKDYLSNENQKKLKM